VPVIEGQGTNTEIAMNLSEERGRDEVNDPSCPDPCKVEIVATDDCTDPHFSGETSHSAGPQSSESVHDKKRRKSSTPQQTRKENIQYTPTKVYPPIAYIRTPFRKRNGTPRQGGLVPSVPARIEFDVHRVMPQHSLAGLEE
jgi:hypothetical protein